MEARPALESAESGPVEELTPIEPFHRTLAKHGLTLERADTTTLQINVGLLCNQVCKHCHLDASPKRTELMDKDTLNEVVAFAERTRFKAIDITGGAPELHPALVAIIDELSPLADRLIVRSNLSALEEDPHQFIEVFSKNRAVVVASLPAANQMQTESQRGKGVFDKSIAALKRLNEAGYGREETGLELNLVSNPTGAFLPPSQVQAEDRFRVLLKKKWDIVFNHLFTFANVPLGRFRHWLHISGNLDNYLYRLASGFNPCAVECVMCRSLMSVAWDGYVYDCDFNLAKALPVAGRKTHISEMEKPPRPGTPIAVADHCYACTAGAGFT
jgi:radical SAM/Cys-rich protein